VPDEEPEGLGPTVAFMAEDPPSQAATEPEAAADAASFQFSTDVAEFVPGQAFQFNPGALEFTPGSPSEGASGEACGQLSGVQSPMATFVQVPGAGAMPVMGVYPVIAVPTGGGGSRRQIAYMSPSMVASPVGHMAMGFRAWPTEHGSPANANGVEWSKGSGKSRRRDGDSGYRGGQKGSSELHTWSKGQEEADEEKPEEEEEEENSNEPKKPSWAARLKASTPQVLPKRVAKAPSPGLETPGQREELVEALPKRVATKSGATSSSGPVAAVPKAVSWGPKAAPAKKQEKDEQGSAKDCVGELLQPNAEAVLDAKPEDVQEETHAVEAVPLQPREGENAEEEAGAEAAGTREVEEGNRTVANSWAARLLNNNSTKTNSGSAKQGHKAPVGAAEPAVSAEGAAARDEADVAYAGGEDEEQEDEKKDDEEEDENEEEEDAEAGDEQGVVEGEQTDKDATAPLQDDDATAGETGHSVEPGKPGCDGVIRYSCAFLKMMSTAPSSKGSCPPSIPQSIRTTAEETQLKQQYGMKFQEQFKEKTSCQDLPENHRIPKELRGAQDDTEEDDQEGNWRTASRKNQEDKCRKSAKGGKPAREPAPKLESSQNSWAMAQKDKKQDADEAIIRQMKSILNKLTVEKFDTLYCRLLECGISTQEHMEVLVKEVFEKATLQHHFIEMYTGLCIKLTEAFKQRGESEASFEGINFRKILLNQCQDSFETYLKPPEALDKLEGEEFFEAKVRYKTKMLGNMKFVGQLLINKALSSKVAIQCMEELLENSSEETLETLCAFLTTIGPEFDHKEWKSFDALNATFKKVARLSKDATIDNRIRCLLKDLLDLRATSYQGHRPSKEPEGPKKMADVKQQWEKDMAAQDSSKSGAGKRVSPISTTGQDVDEWETVGPSSRRGGKSAGGSAQSNATPSSRFQGSGNSFGAQERWSRPDKSSMASPAKGWKEVKNSPTGADLLKPVTPSAPTKGRSLLALSAQTTKLAPSSSLTGAAASASSMAASEDRKAQQFRTEVANVMRELAASHDVEEALRRVRETPLAVRHQIEALQKVIVIIVEYSSEARPCLWSFVSRLLAEGFLQKASVVDGLERWLGSESYEDLKMDAPKLDSIVSDECLQTLHKEAGSVFTSEDLGKLLQKLSPS